MSDYIKKTIAKNKPDFITYKKYIEENDWTSLKPNDNSEKKGKPQTDVTVREEEFTTQNDLIAVMLIIIKRFVKKARADQGLPIFKDFIKYSLSIIDIHIDRIENYKSDINLSTIKDEKIRSEEISFQNTLLKAVSSIEDTVADLNISEDAVKTSTIEFFNDIPAPLSMHDVLVVIYPEIEEALNEMKINFKKPPKNEMHIYTKNPPVWNKKKHYWEQEKATLQYYVDEFKKLKNGITIGGYYISGWMYYHLNIFVTPIPHEKFNTISGKMESEDKIINPPLRDSDLLIFQNILITFLAASRRVAKTTLESSKLAHAATIGKKELLCAGGSTKDLRQIQKSIRTDIQYKNPAFAVHNVSTDWKEKVELGLKTKSNKTILLSTLNIINTSGGNSEEILAGFTPDEFVFDEVMKGKFISALEGLKPALKGTNGLIRCFCILSGTGGDDALSADGLTVLNDPTGNDILPNDWSLLERGMPKDCITWEEDKLRPFGTFIPGQMCVDMPKVESNLALFLDKPEEKELEKIKIKVTDWHNANTNIATNRERKAGNTIAYNKEIVYMPIKPSEIFMSGKENRFPVAEAKAHKNYLLQTGLWDRRRDLYRDSKGKIQIEVSTKNLAPFPHKGGVIDAPFLIFEDPPTEKVKVGTYTAGFDDYATDDSATSSVSSFYVFKNKILGDPFSEKVVASISFRPNTHSVVYDKWLMLMESYQLDFCVFGENFNYEIKNYLDRRHLAEKYLASSLDFTSAFNIANNQKRKTGWNPTTCKKTLFDLFVDYCNETTEVEQENGEVLILKGVQKIDDIGLLDEIILWSEHLNVDRITSAMGAYGYFHFLNSSYRWRVPKYTKDRDNEVAEVVVRQRGQFYQTNGRNSFYKSR
jgi:hypothetical protein